MNEFVSLAVAVFKFTARYSETKMSSTPGRVGPIRTVREKKGSPSAVESRVSDARPKSPGSRKRKTAAAVPAEVELPSEEGMDGCTATCGSEPVPLPDTSPIGAVPQLGGEESSDGSEGGLKGKLLWLFEQDAAVANRRSCVEDGAAVHSHSLSCHAALQSCEGKLTPRETAASPSTDHSTLAHVRHRSRVVEECLEENCRSSVEACLAQCTPLFQHARRNDECCPLDPLDGVVFHKFMVNSRGDLFDYDLKNEQAGRPSSSCVEEGFPGSDCSGLSKKQKQRDDTSSACRPTALKLHAGRTSVEADESSTRFWKGQVKAIAQECQLLRMEREVAVAKWKQGCQQLDQALDAVHTLRMTVDSLMGAKLRASSRRRSPHSTKAARGTAQVTALPGRAEKLRESSTSSDSVGGLYGRVTEVSVSTLKQLRGVKDPEQTDTESQIVDVPPELPTNMDEGASSDILIDYSVEGLSGQTNEEIVPAAVKPLQPAAQRDSRRSTEDSRSKEQFVAAIRGIVEQFQAEDELWSQVQQILHHVAQDMENLFVTCAEWEKRAHNAEALSSSLGNEVSEWQVKAEVAEQKVCNLQGSMGELLATAKHPCVCLEEGEQKVSDMEAKTRDLRRTTEPVSEWQTRARAAEQKVLDLESELSHLKATLEQVKGRHAMEQSRLLEAGTRLRQSGTPRRSNSTELSKSGILEQEQQGTGPAKVASTSVRRTEGSMSGYDMGLDKGTSRHRRSPAVHGELDVVELSQYVLPQPDVENPQLPNADCVEAKVTALDSSEQEIPDNSRDAGQPGPSTPLYPRAGTGRKAVDWSSASGRAVASNSIHDHLDSRQTRQLRCPPRPVSSPKLASKPRKVGLDSIISYSGPMRQCSDLDLVKGMGNLAAFDRPRISGSGSTGSGARIPGARRVSREEGSVGLRRLDRHRTQHVKRNMGIERHDGRSWDADEDRSEFASLDSSSDSDSLSTFESVEDDYSGWTVEMLDKWKETASKELNKVRRKCQLPPNQQRVSIGSRDSAAIAWKHHVSVKKTGDLRTIEEATVKAHLSAERVKAAIPTFQSLFPGKLRKKNGDKVVVHKGRAICDDRIFVQDLAGSEASEQQPVERDSSVPRMRGSFFNGIQKQFLVRNSPSHTKQVPRHATPDRSIEDKLGSVARQEVERKSLRDKKSEGSFLDDIRRHFTGKSPPHTGRNRPRTVSPFPGDQQMHSVMSSPVSSRPPLTEIMGNGYVGSRYVGSRAFHSG